MPEMRRQTILLKNLNKPKIVVIFPHANCDEKCFSRYS